MEELWTSDEKWELLVHNGKGAGNQDDFSSTFVIVPILLEPENPNHINANLIRNYLSLLSLYSVMKVSEF